VLVLAGVAAEVLIAAELAPLAGLAVRYFRPPRG